MLSQDENLGGLSRFNRELLRKVEAADARPQMVVDMDRSEVANDLRMASARDASSQPGQLPEVPLRVDSIPTIVWSTHPDGSLDLVNQRWRDYTGLTLEQCYGWGWKTAIHPDDLRAMEVGTSRGCEVRLRRSDGVFRRFLLQQEALRDEAGAVVRWYGIAIETENRRLVETLGAAEKRTLEMIADGASLREVLDQLCTFVDVQVAPSVTTVLLTDADRKQLLLGGGPRAPREWISTITPVPVAFEAGLCGTAAFLKARVIVPDVATEPNWPSQYRDLAIRNGIRAAWSEPILTKDKEVLGTFALYSHEARIPDGEDLDLIRAAGYIARIAIERQRSQKALRDALDQARKSEARLRRVIDAIPTLAWCNLPEGPNEFLNKVWHEYTGLAPEESHGWGWQVAFHPEDLPPLMRGWQELLVSGEPGQIEARIRRHDGGYRWFLIRVEPFRDETGKIVRWYGTSTDIDDLKRAKDKLRQDEEELRRMTDAIPQAIMVLNPDGKVTHANRVAIEYTGLLLGDAGAEEFRRRIFHPEDVERLREEQQKALLSNVPFENEQRILGKDGKYRWFLIRYNPLLDQSGEVIRWYATATDIDDRKMAEERILNENQALRERIDRDSMFEDVVGSSEALRKVLRQVAKVAPSDSTVLILGETGTGKELIARAIHKRSSRSERAFIGINCAAIPPSLIASELFGHEKGAFTGATQRRLGRFESANGGTIFLDEVGDLCPEIQIALLRVLQEREIERVGSNKPIPVDVRVVAATNGDLDALVAEGKFRQDLLYRLCVVPIRMPSLRERADDIPVLVDYFIGRFGKKAGKKFGAVDRRTTELFEAYQWPGNVRELQNVIERAVILSEGDIFRVDETWLRRQAPQTVSPIAALNCTLQRQEKEMIEAALAECGGRVSGPRGAAAKLGLPRPTLDAKIKRLEINKYRFRVQPSN